MARFYTSWWSLGMSAHFVSWSAAITHLADVKAHVSVLEYQRSDARGDRGTETLKMWNLPARLHNHYRKVSARSAESELRETQPHTLRMAVWCALAKARSG